MMHKLSLLPSPCAWERNEIILCDAREEFSYARIDVMVCVVGPQSEERIDFNGRRLAFSVRSLLRDDPVCVNF